MLLEMARHTPRRIGAWLAPSTATLLTGLPERAVSAAFALVVAVGVGLAAPAQARSASHSAPEGSPPEPEALTPVGVSVGWPYLSYHGHRSHPYRALPGARPGPALSPTETSVGVSRVAYRLQELQPDLIGTGFYERSRGDRGGFFATAEEIDVPIRKGRNVWDVLNTFRGAIARIGLNKIRRFSFSRRSSCFSVWINGRPQRFHSEPPRTIYAEEIAGLEVLRPGEIPFDEFYDTNEVTRCHILGIWLKGRASYKG